jgi:hypothetical protein
MAEIVIIGDLHPVGGGGGHDPAEGSKAAKHSQNEFTVAVETPDPDRFRGNAETDKYGGWGPRFGNTNGVGGLSPVYFILRPDQPDADLLRVPPVYYRIRYMLARAGVSDSDADGVFAGLAAAIGELAGESPDVEKLPLASVTLRFARGDPEAQTGPERVFVVALHFPESAVRRASRRYRIVDRFGRKRLPRIARDQAGTPADDEADKKEPDSPIEA